MGRAISRLRGLARSIPLIAAPLLTGCFEYTQAPSVAPHDARMGRAPPWFDAARACGAWEEAAAHGGEAAIEHDSFPELSEKACFVKVRYGPKGPVPDATPKGCGYPHKPMTAGLLASMAARYARVASGDGREPLPLDLRCSLRDEVRRSAAAHNARVLGWLAAKVARGDRAPYAAVATFGYGAREHAPAALERYRPGDACEGYAGEAILRFGVNVERAERAAAAFHANVGAIVSVSGGAVHSPLVEAFLLHYLASCRFGVPSDAVLLDVCADHTHTNLRNTGWLVHAISGRAAYAITDEGIQAGYLHEWTVFDAIGGSIDQRSLRDFGYLVGAFRRASVGIRAGFWFTPYRFWAEPEEGLGGFTCSK